MMDASKLENKEFLSEKEEEDEDDYVLLKQAWVNELSAPELLPYCHTHVDNLLEQIQHQQEILDTIQQTDQSSILSNHIFVNLCYEMECIRYQYVIRCYLETRLAKVISLYRQA